MQHITVIIPAYNAASTLSRAVASVWAQEYSCLDVCIIDDGSSDNTEAVVNTLRKRDGRVRYLCQTRRGPAAARNLGIRSSAADLIALLDADDEWLPGKVAAQVELFERHPGVGLVFTDSLYVNSATGQSRPLSENNRATLAQLGLVPDAGRANAYFVEGKLKWLVYRKDFIAVSSALMRRGLAVDVGGFNERRFGTEDLDLWVRLADQTRFMYLAEVYARYNVTGHSLTGVSEKRAREMVSYHKACLSDPSYADLRETARRHLRSAYAGLIVFYGRHHERRLALRTYFQSLRDLRAPSLAFALLASACGPRVIEAALSLKDTSQRCVSRALGRNVRGAQQRSTDNH
jgi:glycosyltransferase involved in cell wall biosynthesis